MATYPAKDYSALRGLSGITDEQIEVHLKLYNGYVTRTNALLETLAQTDPSTSAYQELKRRLGWEFNGMRLHEYYFDNLSAGGSGSLAGSAFAAKAAEQYGSVENWQKDFLSTAKAPGIGWTICYLDPANGGLINFWVTEHEQGHPAGLIPVLVCDVFEHAFAVYRKPTDRAPYLDDFFANINWDVVNQRLG
ncbi:MAG: superoxide dismutase [Planctomycetota bacterium]|nr:MAG: superoxide dismutase [Planctomycetota bacterium]